MFHVKHYKKGVTQMAEAQGKAEWTSPTDNEVEKDISEMTRQELAKELRPLAHKVNARLDRLASVKDVVSPAYKAMTEGNGEGKIKIRGKNLNALRHEYARAQAFLNMETSTVTGARRYQRQLVDLLGGEYRQEIIDKIFETFHEVQETHPAELQLYDSKQLISEIGDNIQEQIDIYGDSEEAIETAKEEALKAAMDEIKSNYFERIDELKKEFDEIGY